MTNKTASGCLLLALLVAACAQTRTVYIRSMSTGDVAQTTVKIAPGQTTGTMSVVLHGKTYSGRWVYVAGGGGVSLVSANAFQGASAATAYGTAISVPGGGNGSVMLVSSDGDTLRCVFNYGSWTGTGVGECQNKKGALYDMQITH